MHEATESFESCWRAAALHLTSQTKDSKLSWLKANLTPPFLEHLSFRLGNQLFFIYIEDIEGKVIGPGNSNGFKIIAKGCNGHACRMPMRFNGSTWETEIEGWGLIDDSTDRVIDPFSLVSDEKFEMTEWELHDFAVEVVSDYITQKLNKEIISICGNPGINPSIWFVNDGNPEAVVVRAVKYPEMDAKPPENIEDIIKACTKMGRLRYFASVAAANTNDTFDPEIPPLPLWRGHGMHVRFTGLEELHETKV